jgi:hypothetical protein
VAAGPPLIGRNSTPPPGYPPWFAFSQTEILPAKMLTIMPWHR